MKIAAAEGDARIVLFTDVASIAATVSTVPVPSAYPPPAVSPIAVGKGSAGRGLAATFVAHVLSPAGQVILRKRGFLAPPIPVEPIAPAPVR
jgi:molybdate transport system substrate-binding protein